MILTHHPNTDKQRQEHRLLVSIRFACVMHQQYAPKTNPMSSQRVRQRLQHLEHHLFNHHPSKPFFDQFYDRVGELGRDYALKYNSRTGKAEVYCNALTANLLPLTA